jgi:phosphate:Na+ symporter
MIVVITQLLGGVGMFLFAMHFLENALQELSGRKFKIFLQKMAARPLSAIAGSALITALLQSSSMVSLMILAFLGAGVFTIQQSMALVLGANLGTTIDSWLIATIGFNVNIERAAYPALFLGALFLIIRGKDKVWKNSGYLLLGFAMIFISLSLMRTAMESSLQTFKLENYLQVGHGGFLLIGFLITLLMQSSSVTVAIVLTAIHSKLIPLETGAYIVVGGETATTMKLWLGTIGGNNIKKQLAAGNSIFNIVITLLAILTMPQILYFITQTLGVKNPLLALVSFSSLLNLAGILLFIPILTPYSNWLVRLFPRGNDCKSAYLQHPENCDAESAEALLKKEAGYFIYNAIHLNTTLLNIATEAALRIPAYEDLHEKTNYTSLPADEKYNWVKEHHGEIQSAYLIFTNKHYQGNDLALSLYISAVRNAMHAAKSMKDIYHNINHLSRSSKSLKFDFFLQYQLETLNLFRKLVSWLSQLEKPSYEELLSIYNLLEKNYQDALNRFYKEASDTILDDMEITTLLNFNREGFSANRSLLMALKDLLLNASSAHDFDEKVNFIS